MTPQLEPAPLAPLPSGEAVFLTKALKKFIGYLRTVPSPVLLDLGPVIGSNVAYFGEGLGCKIIIADLFAEVDRHLAVNDARGLPRAIEAWFKQPDASVDGVLCWDLFDFLDAETARVVARHVMRMLRANGVVLGIFRTVAQHAGSYTKFVVVDEFNLRHRPYGQPLRAPTVMQNREIIRLFDRLRVSDSYFLQSSVREILFRKPMYLAMGRGPRG